MQLSLNILADVLRLPKDSPHKGCNLLLTSTISLKPDVLRKICAVDSWAEFRSYLHAIGPDTNDRIELLKKHIGIHNNIAGYRALAYLVNEGYFSSTILTANLDSTLEDALQEICSTTTTFQVLIVGRDTDEAIITALESDAPGIRIIKLRGSLREKVLPEQFPDFFEAPVSIRASLGRYLNHNIVIVGSIEREEDIIREFNANNKSRIHYIIPRKNARDEVTKLIEARENSLSTSLISGPYGNFEAFFRTLTAQLLPERPLIFTDQPLIAYQEVQNTRSIRNRDERYSADVLLVTVTEIEARAIIYCFPESKSCFIGDRAYYDFGIIGGVRVFMVQSEMGADGPGGSRFTVEAGIRALSPCAVIMVGIAFGFDAQSQHIGDILISRQLIAYDHQRVGSDSTGKTTIQMRGERMSAPIRMLDRFKAGFKTWQDAADVYFGSILSGAKLVDNQEYRDQLRQIEPGAIGGEMEGVGLYEMAHRYNVDWMLVKAISDWGDGNKHEDKNERQKEAASNAARFTLHVIQQGAFWNFRAQK